MSHQAQSRALATEGNWQQKSIDMFTAGVNDGVVENKSRVPSGQEDGQTRLN